MNEIDAGPSFDADSITIPDELRETSNFGQHGAVPRSTTGVRQTNEVKQPAWLLWGALILGAAVLGIMAAVLVRGDGPESASKLTTAPITASTNPEPSPPPPPPPAPAPAELKPEAKPEAAIAEKTSEKPEEVAKPVAVAAPKLKSVKKPRKKRKKRSRRARKSLDDALAKLQDFEEESDPNPVHDSMETSEASTQGAAAPAPDAACAQGDVAACVSAGRSAETNKNGAKARQFYGIACAKGNGVGCAKLASLLQRGVGGQSDAKRANSLRGKACKLGHRKSCASVKTTTSSTH